MVEPENREFSTCSKEPAGESCWLSCVSCFGKRVYTCAMDDLDGVDGVDKVV